MIQQVLRVRMSEFSGGVALFLFFSFFYSQHFFFRPENVADTETIGGESEKLLKKIF